MKWTKQISKFYDEFYLICDMLDKKQINIQSALLLSKDLKFKFFDKIGEGDEFYDFCSEIAYHLEDYL